MKWLGREAPWGSGGGSENCRVVMFYALWLHFKEGATFYFNQLGLTGMIWGRKIANVSWRGLSSTSRRFWYLSSRGSLAVLHRKQKPVH